MGHIIWKLKNQSISVSQWLFLQFAVPSVTPPAHDDVESMYDLTRGLTIGRHSLLSETWQTFIFQLVMGSVSNYLDVSRQFSLDLLSFWLSARWDIQALGQQGCLKCGCVLFCQNGICVRDWTCQFWSTMSLLGHGLGSLSLTPRHRPTAILTASSCKRRSWDKMAAREVPWGPKTASRRCWLLLVWNQIVMVLDEWYLVS